MRYSNSPKYISTSMS